MNVETIEFINDLERRVAFVSVKIGEVVIKGVTIWRSPQGRLRVFFPSFRKATGYADVVTLAPDLRAEVEAEIIAAYRDKSDAQKTAKPYLRPSQAHLRRNQQLDKAHELLRQAESKLELLVLGFGGSV